MSMFSLKIPDMRKNLKNKCFIASFTLLMLAAGCKKEENALFTALSPSETGINFENNLKYDENFNIYTYRNFYNGGGVAIGDIDNDNLPDIYMTANMGPNKLYKNMGGFRFEDITDRAGVAGTKFWSTGVTMADVNADGLLDIYVCNSGNLEGKDKENELFINNGDGTFSEKAREFGLADTGYSTHAAFFDYDKDGDLDMYLLNNSYQAIGSFNLKNNVRNERDKEGGDKLFKNEDGVFIDVSESAGIYGSVIGFGLGVTVGDVNLDGWPDIYVSNDFFERDYLYINQKNGTFADELTQKMRSTSVASMGADMADMNNDIYPEIFVTEMLPGLDSRLKTKTTFEDYDKFSYNVENGYHFQYTRNAFHLNNGGQYFQEIGRFSGVHATDWSWGAILQDFDNDGWKDIFVSNGIYQDLTDQDFLHFLSNEETMKSVIRDNKVDYKKLIDAIPSEKISNYFFVNKDGLRFENMASEYGLAEPSHSNGSAYGDLDGDGDLDLVVNNVNMPAFVYRNNKRQTEKDTKNHYLQFKLSSNTKNTFAVGTKILVYHQNRTLYNEHMPTKGFQSSMDYLVHIGLGNVENPDSVVIIWPDNRKTTLSYPVSDSLYNLKHQDARENFNYDLFRSDPRPRLISAEINGIDFRHQENRYVDFDRDRLIYHMLSTQGPGAVVSDFNKDGLDDLFFGGAKDQAAALYLQQRDGSFAKNKSADFEADAGSEDVRATAGDLNGDNIPDVYVCSGGHEFSGESSSLKDRIYINDGKGNLKRDVNYRAGYQSNSAIAASDIDKDGDLDIFVGERVKMFQYGVPCAGAIFKNDNGRFTDVTAEIAPELNQAGMITDAAWVDINADGSQDLVIVGEYMPVTIFTQQQGKFVNKTKEFGLDRSNGWYQTIKIADLNNDGRSDIILGNHGLNSRFKGNQDKPICMHVNDFDKNGSIEHVVCVYEGDSSYPLVLRHDLVKQLPYLKKKYLKYAAFQNQTIEDIFTQEERANMLTLYAYEMRSVVLMNTSKGLIQKPLPDQAQFSPIYALEVMDLNQDGISDIIAGGNLFAAKPETGSYDAMKLLLLYGDGEGNFSPATFHEAGHKIEGEIRAILPLKIKGVSHLCIVRNNDVPLFYRINL